MALKPRIVLNLTFNFKLNQKPNNIFIALFIDLLPLLSVTLSLRYTFIDYRFHFSTQKKDHHRNSKFYYIIPGCASNISTYLDCFFIVQPILEHFNQQYFWTEFLRDLHSGPICWLVANWDWRIWYGLIPVPLYGKTSHFSFVRYYFHS